MLMKSFKTGFGVLALLLGTSLNSQAVTISDFPAYVSAGVPPLVMLDISKDQQLFKKAYNDYSDLDGDGQLETDYKHSIDYYGYFDSYKCYTYTSSRFVPAAVNTDKYCAPGNNYWSGNFLNWVSMTRMDAVRKLLFGGLRSTDGVGASGITVLERAYLPTDAHSWAKYYNGTDINKLTPFPSVNTPTGVTSTTSRTIGAGSHLFNVGASTTSFALGDQVIIRDAANPTTKYMIGAVGCVNGTGINMYNGIAANTSTCAANEIRVAVESVVGAGTINNWSIENWSQVGITICNTTLNTGGGVNNVSQTNINPPLMRVAKGNFALWAANERWQCYWREDSPGETTGSIGGTGTNGNRAAVSGLYASSLSPNRSTTANGRIVNSANTATPDFIVRVEACKSSALIGKEKCRQYPDSNYKPIGLLQTYGEDDLMRFGLMTGSYNKNISGGVLRKNIGKLDDEINFTTDGTFKTPPSAGNIINTLNKLRIYGYNYGDGTYLGSGGDNCSFQLTNITEGNCRSWGNPMSEIFYETLRYFAGKSPNGAYTYGGGSADSILGLPLATWTSTLLDNNNYCAPLNTIVFNASVSTNDDDLRTTNLADINAPGTTAEQASNAVGAVGTGEGINGTTRYVGKIVGSGATAAGDTGFELCTAKTIPGLGQVSGICPEGPTLAGSYLLPGLAYQANTNKIRADLTVPADDTTSLKVKTYGVQLATNVPQIRIAVTGETTPRVIIQPAYRLVTGGGIGGGALVDMRIVSQTATATTASGTIYLNWEDSEQGGDYDQDVWGVLSYSLNTTTNQITVTTRTIAESTNQPQGFGYIITGTTEDGPHFHSGIENFNFNDPTNITVTPNTNVNASGGCNNCGVTNAATTAAYTLGASPAKALEDPLFYAAKWGGFTEDVLTANNLPNLSAEFDRENNTTGAIASDGIPDNYFLVSNPLFLEQAMTKAFLKILATSSASAVATNSTSLRTDSLIFQARFNTKGWSGQVRAFTINTAGEIGSNPIWDAAQRLTQVANRQIITLNGDNRKGMAFNWPNILALPSATQRNFLNKDGAGVTDNRGEDRVAYLRGDASLEGVASGKFRERANSEFAGATYRNLLGDIIFSNPQYVGAPNAGYFEAGYANFRASFLTRRPVLYVGANDGMLHAFNACYPTDASTCPESEQGKELLAFVPGKVYENLSKLTDRNYTHKFFVDGSPTVGDAYGAIGQAADRWRSVLVSGLNAGGQGVFALDVTDPTQFAETNAETLLLWEFTNADDADLGYTYSKPVIARLKNGKWAAIFGNGYNSSNGTAALYILYLDKPLGAAWTLGTNFFKIDTGCNTLATACSTGSNGLSSVAAWDDDGDGNVDYIYGGDLQGNLWKFDLNNASPSAWNVAIGGGAPYTPLFTAKDASPTPSRQPITTAPIASRHPINGILVLFGTGKVLDPTDVSDTKTQTFYAIWDKNDDSTVSGRSVLLRQTINTETGDDRFSSDNDINWKIPGSTPPDHLGWYMDLVVGVNMKGERHVGTPTLLNGVILFNTYIPSTAACDFGGSGFLMALDYANGGLLPFPPFDTNNDGFITSADAPSSGARVGAVIGGTTVVKGGGTFTPPPPPPTCPTPPCPETCPTPPCPETCPTPPCVPPPPPSTCGSGTSSFGLSSTTTGETSSTPLQLRGLCGRVTWRELLRN